MVDTDQWGPQLMALAMSFNSLSGTWLIQTKRKKSLKRKNRKFQFPKRDMVDTDWLAKNHGGRRHKFQFPKRDMVDTDIALPADDPSNTSAFQFPKRDMVDTDWLENLQARRWVNSFQFPKRDMVDTDRWEMLRYPNEL